MNKSAKYILTLFLSIAFVVQVDMTANDLPPLNKARSIGRLKSDLLKAKPATKSTSKLVPKANLADFNKVIGPLFKQKCQACHGPRKAKAKFRIDALNPDLLSGEDVSHWLEVYEVLSNSEMPPEDEPDFHLADEERNKIVDWLGAEIRKASEVRRNEKGHSSFRRMARYEYNNALQDLLGLPYDFVDTLVTETVSEDGFKNSSEHLKMSAMQFETYREIGLQALKKATVNGKQPEPVKYQISMHKIMEDFIKKIDKKTKKPKVNVFNSKDKDYAKSRQRPHLLNTQTGDAIRYSGGTFRPANSAPAKFISIHHKNLSRMKVDGIRLKITGSKSFPLNLSEVAVYSAGRNIAHKAQTTQSSQHGHYSAALLVDGNLTNFAHTKGEKNGWFKLAFDKKVQIDHLRVWPRDGFKDRFAGGVVEFLQGERVVATVKADGLNEELGTADDLVNKASSSPVALLLNANQQMNLNLRHHLPDEGTMRVSIKASRTTMNENEFAGLRLLFGAHTSNNANFMEVVSQADIPVTAQPGKSQMIHFDIPLSEIRRNPFRKNKTTFPRRDELMTIKNISNVSDPVKGKAPLAVLIEKIEISGPYYEQWPPATHTKIFIESNNKGNEESYSREILKKFMIRCWRRPVTTAEVERYALLFNNYRPQFEHFEDAILEVLAAVMASPEFLYLIQTKEMASLKSGGNISDLELANRLSFFLWSSLPDFTLLKLAHQQKLKDPKVLLGQVKRMLADSRGKRFAESFVTQWLGLDGIESVSIDKEQHKSYKADLESAMLQEPQAYFNEVLSSNSSIMDFIHSDYAVINERLAKHYKIPNVYGPHFRKVGITPEHHRGGILTSAIVSTMNSNGKESNPLKRGVWLLEHILHDPPPPPPPNVPEVDLTDPEILKMTLKEQIEDHRDNAACRSCHMKIDPWGIAFENYDAIGAFRTQVKQKPVDATSTLFNKQELAGMEGLKSYLLTDRQDQFAKAFTHKMLTFALGRPLSFSDRREVNNIAIKLRKNGDGLNTLVKLIVTSKIFQSK